MNVSVIDYLTKECWSGVQAICGDLCHSGCSPSPASCAQSQNHLRHQVSNTEVSSLSHFLS